MSDSDQSNQSIIDIDSMDFFNKLRRSPSTNTSASSLNSNSLRSSINSNSNSNSNGNQNNLNQNYTVTNPLPPPPTIATYSINNVTSRKVDYMQNLTSAARHVREQQTPPPKSVQSGVSTQGPSLYPRHRSTAGGQFTPMAVVGPQKLQKHAGTDYNAVIEHQATEVQHERTPPYQRNRSDMTRRDRDSRPQSMHYTQNTQLPNAVYARGNCKRYTGAATTAHMQQTTPMAYGHGHEVFEVMRGNLPIDASSSSSNQATPRNRWSRVHATGVNAQLPRSKSGQEWSNPVVSDEEPDSNDDEASLFADGSPFSNARRAHVVKVSPMKHAMRRSTTMHNTTYDTPHMHQHQQQHYDDVIAGNSSHGSQPNLYAVNPLSNLMGEPRSQMGEDRQYQRYVDQILTLKDQLIAKQNELDKRTRDADEFKTRYKSLRRDLKAAIHVHEELKKTRADLAKSQGNLRSIQSEYEQLKDLSLNDDELKDLNNQLDWLHLRNEELEETVKLVESGKPLHPLSSSKSESHLNFSDLGDSEKVSTCQVGVQVGSSRGHNPEFTSECADELRECQFLARCLAATVKAIKDGKTPDLDRLLACRNPELGDSDVEGSSAQDSQTDIVGPEQRLMQLHDDLRDAQAAITKMYKENVADRLSDTQRNLSRSRSSFFPRFDN